MRIIEIGIEIAAPVSRVWEIFQDFARYPEWNPFITSFSGSARVGEQLKIRIEPPGKPGITLKPKVLVAERGRELRWKGKILLNGLFEGEHYFRLEPSARGTQFHQGEAYAGLLVPLLSGTFPAIEQGFHAMNESLKRRVEF